MFWFYMVMALIAIVGFGVILFLAYIGARVLLARLRRLCNPSPRAGRAAARLQRTRQAAHEEMEKVSQEFVEQARRILRR